VGGTTQGATDHLHHGVPFLEHIDVPEAKETKPLSFQPLRSAQIVIDLPRVLPSVEFEDEASF
jgi:hypothetical protein